MESIMFRLIERGKIVGYERHILCTGTITIQHQKVGEDIWRFIYPDYKYWIPHDSKEQYTGIKDKNGVEIYEEDIVQSNSYKGGEDKWLIRWNNLTYECVELPWDEENEPPNCYDLSEFTNRVEIIGNIHDNPEILKS